MPGQELVDRRQRRRHPARERLVARAPLQRVHPDDPVDEPPEPGHLVAEQVGLAALEPVGADHGDRAADRRALAPAVQQLLERRADPRAALPVLDEVADLAQRAVGVLRAERPRHAGEPGPEAEHLDAPAGRHRGERELHQRPRVRRHRARDVEDQHERAGPRAHGRATRARTARPACGATGAASGARRTARPTARAGSGACVASAAGPRACGSGATPAGAPPPSGRRTTSRAASRPRSPRSGSTPHRR